MNSIYIAKEWFPKEWGNYNIQGVLDDYEGFRILVRGEKTGSPMYRVFFSEVGAYSSIEESSSFNDSRRGLGVSQKAWAFVVENSWYLEEFHKVSSGIRRESKYQHYAFYFSNQLIDVVSLDEPIITNLNEM